MIVTRGQYHIIRVSGAEELISERPTIEKIQRRIGCSCCDTVTLDHHNQTIMVVDDTGMVDNKPVNPKATQLAKDAFGSQYPYNIHGDVAICNDEDFA